MGSVERLEKFWHDLVLTLPWTREMNGAVVVHCPEMPVPLFNNATNINVSENEAENLLNRVINYFSSKKFPFACFRISPLTHPRSFTSLLERYGFKREPDEETSVMVFKEKRLEDKLNSAVKVEEISEDEIDLFDRLLITSFEMPIEWKEVFDKITLKWMRKGAKHYLAYVEGKPVGITTLFSLVKTGGIFSVGTLKEYRRRGIGTTLTVHALMDSINEGNDLHTLQTTKGGNAERLYQKIGFEIDHTISYFVKKFGGSNWLKKTDRELF